MSSVWEGMKTRDTRKNDMTETNLYFLEEVIYKTLDASVDLGMNKHQAWYTLLITHNAPVTLCPSGHLCGGIKDMT
jgi:sulfur relay (sulfurtransferase) complex TusBCD TusD component (DsrE family)